MRLIDTQGEYQHVLLPEFPKITLGETLQDLDLAELAKSVKVFYGDRLVLVPDEVAPFVEAAPIAETPNTATNAVSPDPKPPDPEAELTNKPKRKS